MKREWSDAVRTAKALSMYKTKEAFSVAAGEEADSAFTVVVNAEGSLPAGAAEGRISTRCNESDD